MIELPPQPPEDDPELKVDVLGDVVSRPNKAEGTEDTEPTAEERPVMPEMQFLRADGTPYSAPEAKVVDNGNPLHQIYVEVDEQGAEREGAPTYVNQYKDPRWARTWKRGPIIWCQIVASNAEDMKLLNKLYAGSTPPGAPKYDIMQHRESFSSHMGTYVHILQYREITYFKVLRVT